MVPCQPRQLVIFSLPFAALVAFFWYKRRKSLSRSDPGGTSTAVVIKPVDSPTESIPPVEQKDVCNGTNFLIPEESGVVHTVSKYLEQQSASPGDSEECKYSEQQSASPGNSEECKYSEQQSASPGDSEECKYSEQQFASPGNSGVCSVFHSTLIEDEKDIEEEIEENSSLNIDKVLDETTGDSESQVEESTYQNKKSVIEDNLVNKEQKVILKDQNSEVDITLNFVADSTKSLQENFSLECVDKSDIVKDSFPACTVLSEGKDISVGTSVDTGLGSQEFLSTVELEDTETSMALEQNSDDTQQKTESTTVGLERKLATLGLDTQTPAQRSERDSANHSPAEVMLNSPAISTFSDAHSEGSSDSGKGCSDVVTPPSRTPAGGSSVAGDQIPIIYEFVLPQVIVGRLIGRHGAFLHDIRSKTHTNVFIKRHPDTNTLKICAVEGTQPDIDAALKMIRQKFPLRRFPELTLERVAFVKNSTLPISPENLQLHLVEGVNNDVILSSLITAGHFFLQLPMHMTYHSLYRLACIMNNVYNTQESPPLPDPQPDVVCVAPAHGGWYRAQILSVDKEAHTSYIKFLDYGGFLTVDNSSLRQIRGDFLLLPFQAVECALANVMPAGGTEDWSEEAAQFVQLMTSQQTLQAQVYEYTESGMPLVYLFCTQFYQSPSDQSGYETQVVLLNQELVSRGFAELIDSSQDDDGQTIAIESS